MIRDRNHFLLLELFIEYGIAPEPERVTLLRCCAAKKLMAIESELSDLPQDTPRAGAYKRRRTWLEKEKTSAPLRYSALIEKALKNINRYRDWRPRPEDHMKLNIAQAVAAGRPGFKYEHPKESVRAERAFYLHTVLANVERIIAEQKLKGDAPEHANAILERARVKTKNLSEAGYFTRPGDDEPVIVARTIGTLQDALCDFRARPTPAANLTALRERQNLTRDQLATKLGVEASAVERWEVDGPDEWHAQRLAHVLGSTFAEIYGEPEFPPSLAGPLGAIEHFRTLISSALHGADWGVPEVHFNPDTIDKELDCFLPYELRSSTIAESREAFEQARAAELPGNAFVDPTPEQIARTQELVRQAMVRQAEAD